MLRKITLRLPFDIFEDLKEEAQKYCVSISDVIRERLLRPEISNNDFPNLSTSPKQITNQPSEDNLINLEILFLLREFLFERNGQILKRVDEKMERRFGKDRKKSV
jgi:hypothetical protein